MEEIWMTYHAGDYDTIVVGAGHAGCEAGLASARLGCKTLIITLNMENIGLMPCNPSIGGPAKGHLVREIDALGGEMGRVIDRGAIQIRMLNTGKGPAVYALRAQADKEEYQRIMTETLQGQEGLDVKQTLVEKVLIDENQKVIGIETETGAVFKASTVILCTGTYLKGKVIIGDFSYTAGPNGQRASLNLSHCIKELGIEIGRFKTGTPARVDKRTIDFDKTIIQPGDEEGYHFSFLTEKTDNPNIPCYLAYTNESTHNLIRENIYRSPLYSGKIEGTGPRYCPSIEDKVVRFADKERHQLFIEPEGLSTYEMYVQGMSSSLPEEVQLSFLRTIDGLERVEVMRTGYAIEYDYVIPTQLKLSLETKRIDGLFCAGQINGTSGYEEAAAQGLMAGINAARKIKGKEPFVLSRSDAYIGVLIDDLVTKGTNEPYRMLTSRAEYRLILRQDNADLRLTEKGWEVGLVTEERYTKFIKKKNEIFQELVSLKKTIVPPNHSSLVDLLNKKGSSPLRQGLSLYELLKRTEIRYDDLLEIGLVNEYKKETRQQIEIQIKYEGYIGKQLSQVERFKKLENRFIPTEINFDEIKTLSLEARQKLNKIRPTSIGQASRISGVSPADISVLMIYLEQTRRRGGEDN